MQILDIFFNFFRNLNLRIIIAGFGIVAIFGLIIYLLLIMISSLQERRAALKVRLPIIDGYGDEAFTEPQFTEPNVFLVEMIDTNEKVVQDSKPVDEKAFMTTLTLEAKTYIPNDEEVLDMPTINNMSTTHHSDSIGENL